MTERAFWPAVRWAAAIRGDETTAADALEFHLERVERLNPALNAIIHLEAERARGAARAADRARADGKGLGPLHGVPMTVKEAFQWAGTPVTFGIEAMRDNRPAGEAVVVERLQAAGAILFGKTNVPEGLADFQSYNAIHGTTNNPWDLARSPGGSSGGSAAALAAGLTALEYGSDIGSSIRNPAHFCGVFGHKPTYGLVPPRGHDLDARLGLLDLGVMGPLARSAADLRLALEATAGPVPGEAPWVPAALPRRSPDLAALRVAVWADSPLCPVSTAVGDRVEALVAALGAAGAAVDPRARPAFDPAAAHKVYFALLHSALGSRMPADVIAAQTEAALGEGGAATIARLQTMGYHERQALDEERQRVRAAWMAFFGDFDVLIAPVMPVTAYPHDQGPMGKRTVDVDGRAVPYFDQLFWAGLATLPGLPATVVPAGPAANGLPVGVQLIGAPWADFALVDLAERLEAMGFGFTPPPGY
jgi:amidase